ncbi:MAG TPA: hypothetical protein VHX42_03890 [Candidatus Babeliales bacterium]|jgi:hypothetical protein|nr:hypothetical protein [Candidatus Babeliales bacterium]
MKKTLQNIVLLSALYGGALHASFEFRAPLDFDARGYQHWFLAPADQAWWYGQMPTEKTRTDWNIHMWGLGYSRSGSKAFASCDECDNKTTRHTVPLAELFFGQAVFVGENAFPGGTFAGDQTNPTIQAGQVLVNAINPFLAFAQIAPVITYEEYGANMGIDFSRYLGNNDRFHIGGRVNIPFKIIEVEPDNELSFEETLDDVFVTRIINANPNAAPDEVEYAFRFDFLSTLVFNQTAMPSGAVMAQPVVRYTGTGDAAMVTLAGRALTGTSADQNDAIPAAYATKSYAAIDCCVEDLEGIVPPIPFRKQPNQVTGALGPDGEGMNDQVLFFKTGVDYAGELQFDRAAQSTIFITPRANPDGTITTDSENILNAIQTLVETDLVVSEPATTFFANNGIDLGYQRVVGLGDLEMEVYGGIGNYNNWVADGIFGLQVPTGKIQKSSNQVLYKPTGNNGHTVVKLGLDGGWQPREWFAFEIRPFYFHAFSRVEHRAAPFAGATVVNVGPEVDVNVSWNYFTLQLDFNVFHPHNPDLGFVLGYELYVKGHDHVSLANCSNTATDLLGRPNQPLAVCNYETHTNSLGNKLRGEIFYRAHYFEIFGGGSQIVSGRNMMKETEAHLGLAIYF